MLRKTRLVALTSLGLILGFYALQAQDSTYSRNRDSEQGSASSTATQQLDLPSSKDADSSIDMKKLSEAFGHFIGRNLQTPGLSFDLEGIIRGIRKGAAKEPAPLSEKEYEEMM